MENTLGRTLPDNVAGYGKILPFSGASAIAREVQRAPVRVSSVPPGARKLLPGIRAALEACGARDGDTLSFHHHLRNGDHVLNMVLKAADEMGLRGLRIAASSLFPVHAPLVDHIRTGVVKSIYTAYAAGPVAEAISAGELHDVAVLQTHGGRARAIESGELQIDIAFIAAPTADVSTVLLPAARSDTHKWMRPVPNESSLSPTTWWPIRLVQQR
jgi:citrate lyase subunit alpha/citrate CoA-transferase